MFQRVRSRLCSYVGDGVLRTAVLNKFKESELSPCELYDLYEKLCQMAENTKRDGAFDLFEDAYCPWARVHPKNVDLQR